MGSGERCAIESLTIGRSTAAETIPAAVDARHFGFRNAGNKRERCRKRYQTNRLHSFSRAGDAAPGFQKQNGCGRNAAKGTAFYLTSVVSYCFASDISAFLRIGRAGLR